MKFSLQLFLFALCQCLVVPTIVADFAEDVQKASPKGGVTENPPTTRLEDIMASGTFAGSSLVPFFKRLFLSKEEFQALLDTLGRAVHVEDMIIMAFIGWMTVPSIRWPYQNFSMIKPMTPFKSSLIYFLADHLQQIARIALLVYFVDILKMICIGLGFNFCRMHTFPHAFAQIAYTWWITNRIAVAKKKALRKYVSHYPETFGRMQIVNRLANAALIVVAGFIVLNILQVEMGVAMHSILALGSISTLAVGIASQGIFSQILNGLLLVSSDRIYEGDVVRWGNKLEGTIVKLGWMETIVRGSDETMVSVPNNDLVKQQVSNLSRVRLSQVAQTLRFKLKDADAIPALLDSIKKEILHVCPAVITDGSR
eukprot:scaffold1522_cov166-Amphora_coffeaeformis.AAC.6